MNHFARATALALAAALLPATLAAPVLAQSATIAFDGLQQDTSQPVEVTADSLQIAQADGAATFTGNVLVAQGDMRMAAGQVRVAYAAEGGRIARMHASDGVTFTAGDEAAESREAVYDIDAGTLVMTGDVVLTQGQNALSSNRLSIDLTTGTGTLEGGVRTVFQSGGN
ncbi:lipopolysaccharide transport periplasmic protein LptA [Mesobaculum littorinae]|uniref:Lipopolysaccharide transport periplasmic protein LptA n=1 Tax=Mesobaculum littorinae TaxID=2486419 RepID=A0A438AH03_9RHOB|nr:LptA/OstA family protein [Mesobaculum littorinae]RVV97857.1 lipopolysaccharide transport periplasmic protein LptA [Mesobaculum littorinae]